MNKIDKVILLAEYFGLDIENFKNSYHHAVIEDETIKKLDSNIESAKRFDNERVYDIIAQYEELKEIKPETFEDELIYNAKINFLCSISYEQYYLNPFEIGGFDIKTKSIGELMLKFDGEYVSFNDIIIDTKHSLNYKAAAIRKQVNTYHKEMTEILHKPLSRIKKSKQDDETEVKHSRVGHFFLILLFIFLNLYLLLLLIFQGQVFEDAMKIDIRNIFSYAFYLPFFAIIPFDVFFVLSDCFRKKDQENYYFAKRYLEFGTRHVFQALTQSALNLYNYILNASKTHTLLVDDIDKFAKIGGDELDLYGLMQIKSIKDKKYVKVTKSLRYIFMFIAIVATIFSLVMFILDHYNMLGNLR